MRQDLIFDSNKPHKFPAYIHPGSSAAFSTTTTRRAQNYQHKQLNFMTMNTTMTICQECQGRAATVSTILTPEYHTTPTTMKKSSRRIRFAPTVAVQPIDCTLTPEEHSRSHYSKDEMAAFSLEVKKAVSRTPSTQSACCIVHACEGDCLVGLEADPALRGIAHYLCPNRVRNKYLVRKALLKYRSGAALQNPVLQVLFLTYDSQNFSKTRS